jgi:drug/metabolite transporter (DMT)-like permease
MNNTLKDIWIKTRPHFLLVLTMLIWSGNAVMGKFAVGHISPMVLTFSRWLLAFVIIAVVARKEIRQDWPIIKSNMPYLLSMGVVGYTGFNILLYSSLHHTTAINVAIEQAAMPLVIFLGNLLLYRIGFGWAQVAGFCLTLLGIVLVITGGDISRLIDQPFNRGDTMMFFAVLFYAGYSIALKQKPQLHWLSLLAALFTGALISSFLAMSWEINAGNAVFPTTTTGIIAVIYTGIFASIVAQASFIEGVGKLGANSAGIYINLLPIFAALLAVLLLDETLGVHHAAALILVISGITLVQRQRKP